jgi:hypothetical protein
MYIIDSLRTFCDTLTSRQASSATSKRYRLGGRTSWLYSLDSMMKIQYTIATWLTDSYMVHCGKEPKQLVLAVNSEDRPNEFVSHECSATSLMENRHIVVVDYDVVHRKFLSFRLFEPSLTRDEFSKSVDLNLEILFSELRSQILQTSFFNSITLLEHTEEGVSINTLWKDRMHKTPPVAPVGENASASQVVELIYEPLVAKSRNKRSSFLPAFEDPEAKRPKTATTTTTTTKLKTLSFQSTKGADHVYQVSGIVKTIETIQEKWNLAMKGGVAGSVSHRELFLQVFSSQYEDIVKVVSSAQKLTDPNEIILIDQMDNFVIDLTNS